MASMTHHFRGAGDEFDELGEVSHTPMALDDLWPIDEEAEAIWRARRGRRIAVRCVGWLGVAGTIALGVFVARSPGVRDRVLSWGSWGAMGNIEAAAPAAPRPPSAPDAVLSPSTCEADAGALPAVAESQQDAGWLAPPDPRKQEVAQAPAAAPSAPPTAAVTRLTPRVARRVARTEVVLYEPRPRAPTPEPERPATQRAPMVDDPYADVPVVERPADAFGDPYER